MIGFKNIRGLRVGLFHSEDQERLLRDINACQKWITVRIIAEF